MIVASFVMPVAVVSAKVGTCLSLRAEDQSELMGHLGLLYLGPLCGTGVDVGASEGAGVGDGVGCSVGVCDGDGEGGLQKCVCP